jgi:hypothetical protein
MYRERPSEAGDSGWQFFSGTEPDEYANCAENVELYDVDTIANYDPEIGPRLDAPYPVSFERDSQGIFVQVAAPAELGG